MGPLPKKGFTLSDAEAARLKPIHDHLVAKGESTTEQKFTLTIANEYLKRFRAENSELCKGLLTLSSNNLDSEWYPKTQVVCLLYCNIW